jgi:hypothetical protein
MLLYHLFYLNRPNCDGKSAIMADGKKTLFELMFFCAFVVSKKRSSSGIFIAIHLISLK